MPCHCARALVAAYIPALPLLLSSYARETEGCLASACATRPAADGRAEMRERAFTPTPAGIKPALGLEGGAEDDGR
jgi:hypothetical protein